MREPPTLTKGKKGPTDGPRYIRKDAVTTAHLRALDMKAAHHAWAQDWGPFKLASLNPLLRAFPLKPPAPHPKLPNSPLLYETVPDPP